MADTSPARIAALTVTYNSRAQLDDFVQSLRAGFDDIPGWQLVVADNASTDDSVTHMQELAPEATIVELAENRGYAAGINAAAAAAADDADVLFILNPDVRLQAGAVSALAASLDKCRVAAPRIVGTNGELEPNLRRETTALRALGEAVLGGDRAGRHNRLGEMITVGAFYDEPHVVDWASGCALMVDRDWFERLGGLDESFFHGAEEADFCLRTADAGGTVRYEPAATVQHLGGDGAKSTRLRPIMFANRLELYRRRRGPARAVALRAALLLNEALRLARHPAHRATFMRLSRPGHPSRR